MREEAVLKGTIINIIKWWMQHVEIKRKGLLYVVVFWKGNQLEYSGNPFRKNFREKSENYC